ncbi:MAG: hypothetical protein HRT73_07595 [Flavobacteriales bacterium]|nr:hypothetical protein [Flavobacteriales bacterium]
MKKLFVLFYFGFCLSTLSLAVDVDELKQKVDTVSNDTLKVKLLEQLCWKYLFSEPEIAQEYADKGLELAKKNWVRSRSSLNLF